MIVANTKGSRFLREIKIFYSLFCTIWLAFQLFAGVDSPVQAATNPAAEPTWQTTHSLLHPLNITAAATNTQNSLAGSPVKLYKIGKVRSSELDSSQFINADTVAYLQDGNLSLYNLTTEEHKTLLADNDVTAFAWSEKGQQFAVAKQGRLLLVDALGQTRADLSAYLAPLPNDFDFNLCQASSVVPSPQVVDLTKRIVWVGWNPDQRFLIFSADLYSADHVCISLFWSLDLETAKIEQLSSIGRRPAWPEWLTAKTYIIQRYGGGGGYLHIVTNLVNKINNFSIFTWGVFPQSSPNGKQLATISIPVSILRIWDVASGYPRLTLKLPVISGLLGSNYECWSVDGRYLNVVQSDVPVEKADSYPADFPWLRIFDLEAQTQWLLPEKFGLLRAAWLPDQNELLLFSWQFDTTTIYLVNPDLHQVTRVGAIAGKQFSPEGWSFQKRYLALKATDEDGTSTFWLWDKNVGGMPFLIGQPVMLKEPSSSVRRYLWGPNDRWLLIIREDNFLKNAVDGVLLEAIRVGN